MIIVFLCAGQGTRMESFLPKPLMPFCGKSFVSRLVDEFENIADHVILVIQEKHLALFEKDLAPVPQKCRFVFQNTPLGTGHALGIAFQYIQEHALSPDYVMCINGDMPLLKKQSIESLLPCTTNALLGFFPKNPYGYGRIRILPNKTILIVEEKDCSETEKKIPLVNAGIYWFRYRDMERIPPLHFSTENAQQEMYITQYIDMLQQNGARLEVFLVPADWEYTLHGVNTRKELQDLESRFSHIS